MTIAALSAFHPGDVAAYRDWWTCPDPDVAADLYRSRREVFDAIAEVLAELNEWGEPEPPHVGHFSRLGGTYWCDTCNSPYCELL